MTSWPYDHAEKVRISIPGIDQHCVKISSISAGYFLRYFAYKNDEAEVVEKLFLSFIQKQFLTRFDSWRARIRGDMLRTWFPQTYYWFLTQNFDTKFWLIPKSCCRVTIQRRVWPLTLICIAKMASYQLGVILWYDWLITFFMHTKF